MAGLYRTSLLVLALIPWLMTGCAGTGSRLANWRGSSAESQADIWAQAQRLEQEGRHAEARQLYAHLYQADSTSARYAHRMGVVSTLLGDHAKATAAYRRALELEPENAELLADAGYSACLQKDYATAEQLLKASLAQAADNPRAKSNLALAVGLQGRDAECEQLFRAVHGQDEVEVLCNLAYVKSQRGDLDQAISLYQQAVAIDPSAKKATVALTQLKADARAATIAQQKPYRKFMNENRPAVAAAKPMPQAEIAQSAAEEESDDAAAREVAQAVGTHAAEIEPTNADENLTEWSESEAGLESPAADVVRSIPLDEATESTLPETAADSPEASVQTVTTDDAPFTVVEAPASDETAGEAEANDFADIWAAGPESEPNRYSPEAQAERLAQITARSGQSGFMGFCPVALRDETRLLDTQPQFTAEYQSQSYQFSSEAAQKKFEANPERYLAAAGGLDVVAVSQGTAVAQGSLEHALWFRHKLYLFLNAENRELFRQQARQFAVQQ